MVSPVPCSADTPYTSPVGTGTWGYHDLPLDIIVEGNFTWATSDFSNPRTGKGKTMQRVFVVGPDQMPLMPCRPVRARYLLTRKRAAVLRHFPFTIILKDMPQTQDTQPLRVKIDPGSKTTGLAVVHDQTGEVVWAAEVTHRGEQIRDHLTKRRANRSNRRQRKTRYRPARCQNRRRPKGWLPPSLKSRMDNILTWVARLIARCPIGSISQELVRFDTHALQHPEIEGIEYQQGTLFGYEVREYLLEKFGRTCAYCQQTGVPLQIEHIVPKARGGSNRVTNLTLACAKCNQQKGTQTAEEFGHPEVQKRAHKPLKDAAAVNSTRWVLYGSLQGLGLPVETGTGGRTKYNRSLRQLPKTHWLDAACVGASTPEHLRWKPVVPLLITATGRHSRQMCKLVNKQGKPFHMSTPKEASVVGGYRSGDMVRAIVPAQYKTAGTHVGKIGIRSSGSCDIWTRAGRVAGVHYRYFQPLHRKDGYMYQKGERAREMAAA